MDVAKKVQLEMRRSFPGLLGLSSSCFFYRSKQLRKWSINSTVHFSIQKEGMKESQRKLALPTTEDLLTPSEEVDKTV